MDKINISDFEELEYDLENIGLKGFFLVIEEDSIYLYGDNIYINIKEFKKGQLILTDNEGNSINLTIEQSDIIYNILNK